MKIKTRKILNKSMSSCFKHRFIYFLFLFAQSVMNLYDFAQYEITIEKKTQIEETCQ